jgi:hypothetical protein
MSPDRGVQQFLRDTQLKAIDFSDVQPLIRELDRVMENRLLMQAI